MTLFQALLLLAAFLCSLVAGLLFTFAIVVMPGIAKLNDRDFVRTFQAIDGVIQNNQPLFLFVWAGSAVSLILVFVLDGSYGVLLFAAANLYVFGVQLPTIVVNLPLNKRLQKLEPSKMNDAELSGARSEFEPRWNRWNRIRTLCACLTSILLLVLLRFGH